MKNDQIKASILLCEDDVNYGMLLAEYLRKAGYRVDWVQDGDAAWDSFNNTVYDICLFNVELPYKNGLELAELIRNTGSITPIIFLSAKSAKDDILAGYHAGCDDYIVKPISMDILTCKIDSMARRARIVQEEEELTFQLGSVFFDSAHQTLQQGDKTIKLSSRESELLKILALHPNRLVERKQILQTIWRNDSVFAGRSLSVYVNHLRNWLADVEDIKILSVHGKGYKIVLPNEA